MSAEQATSVSAKETFVSEAETTFSVLQQLVEPLAQAVPGRTEVVLHDLRRLPDSIVAVGGDLTGRNPGDPATDFLLEGAASGQLSTEVGYGTVRENGMQLTSTTIVIRDLEGTPIAALCINGDDEPWRDLQKLIQAALPKGESAQDTDSGPREFFARNVDELADSIVARTIREQGIPVELMHKEHKVAVVRAAKARGLFMLRDAIEMLAQALGVTRFTIYNYLATIKEEDKGE